MRKKYPDIKIGDKFGLLTVLDTAPDYVSPNGSKVKRWKCICDCGNVVVTRDASLKSGHIKGCGRKHRIGQDMVGLKFGKLTVLCRAEDYVTPKGVKHRQWLCKCDCGNEKIVRGTSLRSGHTVSCGCQHSDSAMGIGLEDLSGCVFGRWHVLYENGRLREPSGRLVPLWHCRCECGTERDIRAGTLKSGNSLSCGCYKHDKLSAKMKSGFGLSHAERVVNKYLTDNSFYYEPQYVFSDLKSDAGYPLPYDFGVYRDGKVFLLIECQGVQHYKPVDFFGGKEYFPIRQRNDALKKMYALNNGFRFLEIPYWVSDTDSIIQLLQSYL